VAGSGWHRREKGIECWPKGRKAICKYPNSKIIEGEGVNLFLSVSPRYHMPTLKVDIDCEAISDPFLRSPRGPPAAATPVSLRHVTSSFENEGIFSHSALVFTANAIYIDVGCCQARRRLSRRHGAAPERNQVPRSLSYLLFKYSTHSYTTGWSISPEYSVRPSEISASPRRGLKLSDRTPHQPVLTAPCYW
jgi:hypothetical protein